ncbi:uncharacterized protein LOC119769081 [Culex quinquefasciatus]|uniref:uncharacterized protein LOC119769081 n=1 Tax=Culex quinquefasciatus TaxID=7176 RepID=UPI0018E2A30E|nr:uncharacterized protein LOC119769081 [Culex quinquefasciatus]
MLEAKLNKEQKLYDDYRKFMQEYIDLGHMERVGTFSLAEPQELPYYFLPHHAVVRPESRQSLNDQLLVGPTLQPRLIDNLLSFRTYKVVVTSDVAKMFRQIDVRKEDRRFQQILWRTSPDEDIDVYQLTTVTYGTACAPFLATRALLQTCTDEAEHFPLAAIFGKNSVYMDDVLFGAETVEEALEMQRQLTGMLGKAGFELQKWCSAANYWPAYQRTNWSRNFDIHSIAFSEGPPTKRKVLSDISKFFDPCGLAAPVVMTDKIYMQDLWRGKNKWDVALKEDLAKLWIEYRDELSEMKTIRISRCVLPLRRTVFVELIGFSDASQKGYGANFSLN